MKARDTILNNDKEVLTFLKSRFTMYHLSNIFFRDIQYGIREMLERRGTKIGYTESEEIAKEFVRKLEKEKILVPIDQQAWVVYYPEFKKSPVKPAAPAKPAASAPPKPGAAVQGSVRPAGGLPPLKSATPAAGAKPALPPLKSSSPAAGARPALPPLKSSAPSGQAPPAPAQASTVTPPRPPQAVQQEEPKKDAPKPATGENRPSLPPIKSSRPVGSK